MDDLRRIVTLLVEHGEIPVMGGGVDPAFDELSGPEEEYYRKPPFATREDYSKGQLVQPRQGFYKKGFVKQKPTAQHLEIAKNYYKKPFHKLTNKQQLRIKGGTTTGFKKVASIEDSALVKKAEKVLKKNIKNKNGYKVFKIKKGIIRDKVKPGGLIDQLMNIGLKDQHKITKLIDEIAEKNNWLTRDVYRRNVIVDSFMKDYGEFDEFTGRGKYDPRLEEFKIKTPENEYKWINNTFEEWKDGKFEVEGYDRKKFDKNLKKNLKNWKPINLSKKIIATQEELKWLDQMNTKHPNWSVEKVEKAFNKQFKDSEFFMDTSFNNRALDLYPHKMVGNNKGYTLRGVGKGKRSTWLSQIMRENRGGNYTKMLLASEAFENKGNIQAARKLKEGAELFFGKKGIFTKMGGEAEHPWFRNYGGWEGEFKIDSLVKGDLNAFKASNFDFPVRDLIKKYEAKGVSDAMKVKLKSEIELRKNFLNFFTDIGDGGMARTITFDFDATPGKVKVINTTPNVYKLHKAGQLDPFEMAERGKLYRKTLVGNLGGSFLKKDETIKGAKIGSERMVNMLKDAGFRCSSSTGGDCPIEGYRKSFNEVVQRSAAGDPKALTKLQKFTQTMKKLKGPAKWTGYGLLGEIGFMVPFAAADYASGESWKRIMGNASDWGFGPMFGQSEDEEIIANLPEGSLGAEGQEALAASERLRALEDPNRNFPKGRIGMDPQRFEESQIKVMQDSALDFRDKLTPFMEGPRNEFLNIDKADQSMMDWVASQELIKAQKEQRIQERRDRGFIAEEGWEKLRTGRMGGGIAGIRRPDAIPPRSGPSPDGAGLSTMFNRAKRW